MRATGKSLWELVSGDSELDESRFVDAVVRNLKTGRFLLLIAGDGIREEMERMAEFLQETPQLRFTLALVELQVYRVLGGDDLLTMPLVVGRTSEVERAVVRVTGAVTAGYSRCLRDLPRRPHQARAETVAVLVSLVGNIPFHRQRNRPGTL